MASVVAEEELAGQGDYFEVTGTTPAEFAEGLSETMFAEDTGFLVGLVGLPMSAAHRAELEAALKNPKLTGSAAMKACRLVLLEEEERYAEALELERNSKTLRGGSFRVPGYLWRLGREEEAREAVLDVGRWPARTSTLVEIDLRTGRKDEAEKLLRFLLGEVKAPAGVRESLCRDYARIFGRVPAGVSRAVEAGVLVALGKEEQAAALVGEADYVPDIADAELLVSLFPESKAVAEWRSRLLGEEDLPMETRRGLLKGGGFGGNVLAMWYGMAAGHAECADLVVPSGGMSGRQYGMGEHLPAIRKLVEKHPGDKVIEAVLGYYERIAFAESADERLMGVAKDFRVSPESESVTDDPALFAIQLLANSQEGAELWELFSGEEAFGKLPVADRMRYLMAAQLDARIMALLGEADFSDGAYDGVSVKLAGYLSMRAERCVFPKEAKETLARVGPDLALGGRMKPVTDAVAVMNSLNSAMRGQDMDEDARAEVYERFLELSKGRGQEYLDYVWRDFEITFRDRPKAKAPVVGDRKGNPVPARLEPPRPKFTSLEDGVLADLLPFVGKDLGAGGAMLPPSPRMGQFARIRQESRLELNPLKYSAWRDCLKTPQAGEDATRLAKVRSIYGKDSERALIYDFTVAFGMRDCPDEEIRRQAVERFSETGGQEGGRHFMVALYLARVLSGMPVAEAVKALEKGNEGKQFEAHQLTLMTFDPNVARTRGGISPEWMAPLVAAMGKEVTAKPQVEAKPVEMSLDDRFQFYREAGKNKDAEVLALARKTLLDCAEGGGDGKGDGIGMAKDVLYENEVYQDFLKELEALLAGKGFSEVEIARSIFAIERRNGVWIRKVPPFWPRRLFELEPDNAEAAREVLTGAVDGADRELVLKCLRALCGEASFAMAGVLGKGIPYYGSAGNVSALGLFTGEEFGELVDYVLALPKPPFGKDFDKEKVKESLVPFFMRVAKEKPGRLGAVLEWADYFEIRYFGSVVSLVDQMPLKDREKIGARLLADLLLNPPHYAEKPGQERYELKSRELFRVARELQTLVSNRREWAAAVAGISGEYPESAWTDGARFLILVAAEPTVENWEKLGSRFLVKWTPDEVRMAKIYVEGLLKHVAGSEKLRLLLDAGSPQVVMPPSGKKELYQYYQEIEKAGGVGNAKRVEELYRDSAETYKSGEERDRHQFDNRVFESMAKHSSGELWGKYFAGISSKKEFAEGWVVREKGRVWEMMDGARLEGLARVALDKVAWDGDLAFVMVGLFKTLVKNGCRDKELLERFRPWFETSANRGIAMGIYSQQLDLILGSPQAVNPFLRLSAGADGVPELSWVLSAISLDRERKPFVEPVDFLKGKFDLEVLGGEFADRLELVGSVEAAGYSGKMRMPEGTKFATVIARERGGKLVRITSASGLETRDVGFRDFVPSPVMFGDGDLKPAVETVKESGPFFSDDSLVVSIAPGEVVNILEFPWNGREIAEVEGLISAGECDVEFRTLYLGAEGKMLGEGYLSRLPWAGPGLAYWTKLLSRGYGDRPPFGTERIVMVAKLAPEVKEASVFRLCGMTMKVPEEEPRYAGFEEIATVREMAGAGTAMSGDGTRLMVRSGNNVGVFDFATKSFSGWVVLPESRGAASDAGEQMLLAGGSFIVSKNDGTIFSISLEKKSAKIIAFGKAGYFKSDTLALSPDGRFLAWPGTMAGVHLLNLDEDGEKAARIVETPQIRALAFSEDSRALMMGGQGALRLSLGDWRNAVPESLPSAEAPGAAPSARGIYGASGELFSEMQKTTFRTHVREGMEKGVFSKKQRTVYVERGTFHAGAEGRIYYVSPGGRISLVKVEKIKEYVPPDAE